jgi:hypothetical protein
MSSNNKGLVGLGANAEMSRHQNAGQNHNKTELRHPLKMWKISNIWERQ